MRQETIALARSVTRVAIVAFALGFGLPSVAGAAGTSTPTQSFGFTGAQILAGRQSTQPLSLLQGQHGTFGNSFGFRPTGNYYGDYNYYGYYGARAPEQQIPPPGLGVEGATVTPVAPPPPDAHLVTPERRAAARGQVVVLRPGLQDEVIATSDGRAPQ